MKVSDVSNILDEFENATQVLDVRLRDEGVVAKVVARPVIAHDPDPAVFAVILADVVAHVVQAYDDLLDHSKPNCPSKADVHNRIVGVLIEMLQETEAPRVDGTTVHVAVDGSKD